MIDSNAPLHDEDDNGGPIDSDEEKDAVMASLARWRPTPLVEHKFIPTRRKYQIVRMKEMLASALGGSRNGANLFSTGPGFGQGQQAYFGNDADGVFEADMNYDAQSRRSSTAQTGGGTMRAPNFPVLQQ